MNKKSINRTVIIFKITILFEFSLIRPVLMTLVVFGRKTPVWQRIVNLCSFYHFFNNDFNNTKYM